MNLHAGMVHDPIAVLGADPPDSPLSSSFNKTDGATVPTDEGNCRIDPTRSNMRASLCSIFFAVTELPPDNR